MPALNGKITNVCLNARAENGALELTPGRLNTWCNP
jgi:hypothetical protein